LIVRLNGQFDSCAQPALHEAFRWIESRVIIDLGNAWLGAAALAEVVCLARRLGARNVTLTNLSPMMRRMITGARMDRLVHVALRDAEPVAPKTSLGYVQPPALRPQALSRTARAARLERSAAC
jgi:hypothetical protein